MFQETQLETLWPKSELVNKLHLYSLSEVLVGPSQKPVGKKIVKYFSNLAYIILYTYTVGHKELIAKWGYDIHETEYGQWKEYKCSPV